MFHELEVLKYHKTFFQSLTEKNNKEFVGMISYRIKFSCCEKQSVQLEWTGMKREKNNGLDKTVLYYQKKDTSEFKIISFSY
jgi:hypothetical protein